MVGSYAHLDGQLPKSFNRSIPKHWLHVKSGNGDWLRENRHMCDLSHKTVIWSQVMPGEPTIRCK
jgi:hypothetical protein